MICHITIRAAWEAAQASGQFLSPEFDEHGFIHCSTPEQVLLVANAFFSGRSGLVLLVIDPARFHPPGPWPDIECREPVGQTRALCGYSPLLSWLL